MRDDDNLIQPGDALGYPMHRWQLLDEHIRQERWREGLAEVESVRRALADVEYRLATMARRDGASWSAIGDALGISKQAAHLRYGREVK